MSKKKRRDQSEVVVLGLSESSSPTKSAGITTISDDSKSTIIRISNYLRSHWIVMTAIALVLMLGIGVMARNGWLPHTDNLTGKKFGWFGAKLPKTVASNWIPSMLPSTTPTPLLKKEYIYAGSRLLASVETGATEIPPADLAVWRPSNGNWYVLGSENTINYGADGDIPVQGDYDGDGKTDFCVFRPSATSWYIKYSSDGTEHSLECGLSTDVPIHGDFDGDGKTDIGVFRPSNRNWYIIPSSDSASPVTLAVSGSTSGDVPAAADYDGDGKADIAIWRSSTHTFYSVNSSNSALQTITSVGTSGDTPVPADYDGDGKADYAVLSGNVWKIRTSSTGTVNNTTWQTSGYTPVPNDYDGDGKVDIAEFHIWYDPMAEGVGYGVWKIRQSSDSSTRTEYWGTIGDIPVPSYFKH